MRSSIWNVRAVTGPCSVLEEMGRIIPNEFAALALVQTDLTAGVRVKHRHDQLNPLTAAGTKPILLVVCAHGKATFSAPDRS